MKEWLTPEFIKKNGLNAFLEKTKCIAKESKLFPSLVLLKYDQLNSDFSDPMVSECRGLILDKKNEWEKVSLSYTKFFNHGDPKAAKLDWTTAKILEKADGSLCTLYNYNGNWIVATSGTPDANASVGQFNFSFGDLFWRVWKSLGYPDVNDLDRHYIYSFELISQFNLVVCQYNEDRLLLHGIRNQNTFEEELPDLFAKKYGFVQVKEFDFNDETQMLSYLASMKTKDGEGFVVRDGNFNRVKFKCDDYLLKAHLKESVVSSLKNVVAVVQKGEIDEVVAQFPRWEPVLTEIKNKFDALVLEAENLYKENKAIKEQREFALKVKDKVYSGVMFAVRANKIESVKKGFELAEPDHMMRWLGFKHTDFLELLQ